MFSQKKDGTVINFKFDEQTIFIFDTKTSHLKNVHLRPKGEALLNQAVFRWREEAMGIIPVIIDNSDIQTSEERITIIQDIHSEPNPELRNHVEINVTYDRKTDRLIYHVNLSLEIDGACFKSKRPFPNLKPFHGLEVFNIWPRHMADDIRTPDIVDIDYVNSLKGVDRDWSESRRQIIIYEGNEATYCVPINQYIHSQSQQKLIRPGGRLGFFNHPSGNPTIKLLPGTNVPVMSDRCHLCHDEHIIGVLIDDEQVTEIPPGTTGIVEFAFYDSYGVESDELMRIAQKPSYTESDFAIELPRRELDEHGFDGFENPHPVDGFDPGYFWVPVSGFETGISSNWFWATPPLEFLQKHCVWERSFGRSGLASLKIITDLKTPKAGWESPYMPICLKPNCCYLLTAWVKTSELHGKGAFLGYYFGTEFKKSEKGESYKVSHQPDGINGTNDWTKLQLTLKSESPLPGHVYTYLLVRFWQEGEGVSWWDDVSLVPLDNQTHTQLPYQRSWRIIPTEVMKDIQILRENNKAIE